MTEQRSERHDPRRGRVAEAQLMERIRRGDVRAFEQLVREHWDGLVAYAMRMTNDRDAAQDVVQETLARFWQTRAERHSRVSLRGYLYRSVRNRVIDLTRQRRTWERWSARFRHELFQRPRTPADLVAEAELPPALGRAIQALPERRREVFILAHFQDLSYDEIAEIMDLAPQTVANHMSLALRDLRRSLGPCFPRFAAQASPPATSVQQNPSA